MTNNFDEPIKRTKTGSLKWDKYKNRDILPLWVADMDFKSPSPVLEALHQRIDHGVFGYTLASEEINDVIIQRMKNLYNWHVKKNWIIWIPGLVTGLNISCRAVGDPGDEVITMVPVYGPFLTAPGLSDRKLATSPLIDNGDKWVIDFEALEANISNNTKLLLLCNPQNPTGRVYDQVELEKLVKICEKHKLILCSDEIHCDLIIDQNMKHVPIASLSNGISQRSITLMAPSKSFNIPGLGCSFAIIENSKLRLQFQRAMQGIVPHVNTLGYTAALAAYQKGEQWLNEVLEYLKKNYEYTRSRIGQIPGMTMRPMEATYLAWISTQDLPVENPVDFFEKSGVGLSNGLDFGAANFLRLNFACSMTVLEQALDRMERAVKTL
ncbi:MAG: putative C-S lyase [Proteobacteria bacterium]|nr:putative C-S lyase [Pseudomonadota bacterium]